MAEYRLSAQVISRAKGRSATGAAAYRAAERIVDARTGEIFDYRAKGGVEHREIIAPEHAPDWAQNRSELWNRVEAGEARRDSQLSREFELMLPRELNVDQRRELVQGFVRDEFVERGMVADVAMHNPRRPSGQENPHAHVMTTMRDIGRDGFGGQKNRDWNSKDLLQHWREGWADHCNRSLERAGRTERVDHRSYADRGIDREAQPKMGRAAAMEDRGIQTDRGDMLRAVQERNDERSDLMRAVSALREGIAELKDRAEAFLAVVRNPVKAVADTVINRLLGRDESAPDRSSADDSDSGRPTGFGGKKEYVENVQRFWGSEPNALLGRGDGDRPLASPPNRESVNKNGGRERSSPSSGGRGRGRER